MTLSGTEVPPQRRTSALRRQATAVLVAACLVVLAPGLDAYSAFAAGFQKGPSGPSQIPTLTLPTAPALPGAAAPGAAIPNLAVPQLPGSALNLPAAAAPLPGVAGPSAPAALPQAAAANPLIPGAAAPNAAVPGAKPTTTEGILRAGAGEIAAAQSAKSESGVSQALESMFTGGKAAAASFGDVAGSVSGGQAPLAPLPLDELKTIARDSKKPDADRQAAVKAIADRSNDASKLALEEIGTERGGGPADYEIKRLALRRLADQGKVVSLPPVSDEHAAAILNKLSKEKPEVAAFDYDGTLEKSGAPATAETGAALKALSDSGVETMILTDRSVFGRRQGDVGILDSLSPLTAAQKAAISVGANRGARILAFDAEGNPQTVAQSAPWTSEQRIAVEGAAREVASSYGVANGDKDATLTTDYDFAVFFPKSVDDAQAAQAGRRLETRLAELGIPASIVPRRNHADEGGQAYLTVSKYDKSLGSSRLRALRETLDRFRDAERLPKALRSAARALLSKLPSKAVPAASALLVGDHFFGPRGVDSGMIKGAPGALAISVGGTADPRLDNAFVWNKQGHEASMELMRAASGPAAPQMEGMNWKAFAGLFGSRTASIVAFLGTTLAYAKVAIGSVGPTHFGTLAALGGLVSIAAGPLTGKIADKFSARTGMAINTILRAVFLLDLPLFTAFGVLNFWTLLLGSIANGWLLSSIMTTEGAYLRRLFGFKNLRTANSLLQLNYFFLQIIFGLVLGIGGWVDGHNPMIPFYIASAVNALVVLPIIWKTMPTTAPVQNAPAAADGAATAKPSVLAGMASFIKTYWKEALLLGASIASFPILHSALPITGALVWWIARTPGFKAIKADKPIISAVAMVSLGAFLFYGLQSYLLPTIATTLVGKANSSLMLGKMLGAVFLGQMLSSSSMAKLPVIRVPFLGRFGLQRLVQAAVIGVTGLWVYTGLFPGSILAAAAFMGVAGALIAAAHYLTDKGWIGMIGAGMGFLALPALFWGNIPVLLGSLAVFGFFYGPAAVALSAYIQRRADPAKIGQIMGIQGSLFNAAISLGIGSVSLIAGLMSPMFPATLAIVAAVAAVIGAVYFLGSKKLPGLPAKSLQTKEEVKK